MYRYCFTITYLNLLIVLHRDLVQDLLLSEDSEDDIDVSLCLYKLVLQL